MKEFYAIALKDIESLTWDSKKTGKVRVKKNKVYKFAKTFDALLYGDCYEYIDEFGIDCFTYLESDYFTNNFRILND